MVVLPFIVFVLELLPKFIPPLVLLVYKLIALDTVVPCNEFPFTPLEAFNAWLKVVIPFIVFVLELLPNVIPPLVLVVYKLIALLTVWPCNVFVVWIVDDKLPVEALYNNAVFVLRFDEPDAVDEKGI